ncbi:MAG TPA: HAD family hydrolase [Chloroflexi bacterium]|nr:HAD family hydrolase [Chloroflexota bacterium]
MQVKLLALDLDGTIVTNLRDISEPVKTAIQAAMDQGVVVTIATGRAHVMAKKFAHQLNINAPIISYQGGMVKDHRNGALLLTRTTPGDLSRRVIKFARAKKLPMVLFTSQGVYTELPSDLMRETFARAGMGFTIVHNLLCSVDDEQLPFKFLFPQPATNIKRLSQLLSKEFGEELAITRTLSTLIEMTLLETSKGTALQFLAQHLDIPIAQTMAIGDEENDVSMLEIANLGVAIGNASQEAKAAADVIAPSIAEDGAAWAIGKYVLGE